ncbi:MAG TPA: hypothetical protein VFR10_14270, partial [bacterium]|nr:hypothetical protein [bacterium]
MIRNRRVVQGGGVLQSFGAVIASVLAASIFAATAHAQEDLGFFGYGARLGASIEPDQFNVGAYVKLGKVTQMVSFRPSLDLGFG